MTFGHPRQLALGFDAGAAGKGTARAVAARTGTARQGAAQVQGSRAGIGGRKRRADRVGFLAHRPREGHDRQHPLHVTMKRVPAGPSFRAERVHTAIVSQIAACVARGVRVVHYSVQHDHLHLLVEAEDASDAAKRLKLLFSRIAMSVNRVARRHGSLFRDRHHRRALSSPKETRNVLVYLFFNRRKHELEAGRATNATFDVDEMTSAGWFDGWHPLIRPSPEALARARSRGAWTIMRPRTWLAREGWLRAGGPIGLHELPALALSRRVAARRAPVERALPESR